MKVLRMLIWLFIIPAIVVLFGVILYFYQKSLVFHPTHDFALTPDQSELQYDEIYVNVTPQERLHGWYFPSANPDSNQQAPVVLFCHGNAGNISHRLETVDFLLQLGARVLLFDYRGYGRSDGSVSEENVYADAGACYNWLREKKNVQPEDIVLFGRSLGGAVAIELAQRVSCRGLIVESSFTSAEEMGRRIFPFLPIKYVLRYRFDSISKIGSVSCPILVTHSPDDDVVPFDMGQRLFEAAPQPRQFVRLRGGHNDREYLTDSDYIKAVTALIHGRLERT